MDRPQSRTPWLHNPVGLFGLIIVIAFFVLGVFGPCIAPYDPRALDADVAVLQRHRWRTRSARPSSGRTCSAASLEGARLSMTVRARRD